jgi:hypothetical protein
VSEGFSLPVTQLQKENFDKPFGFIEDGVLSAYGS